MLDYIKNNTQKEFMHKLWLKSKEQQKKINKISKRENKGKHRVVRVSKNIFILYRGE